MSKAAIVIVGGLAIAYTGASWYTGTKTEETLGANIAIANTYLLEQFAGNKDNVVVQIKAQKYDRGIFSSKADYAVEVISDDTVLTFPYTSEIYHGPWPVKAIAQGQLLPVMSYVHSELKKEGNNLGLFTISKNPAPLTVDSYWHWNGSIASKTVLSPLTIADNAQSISIDTTTINSDMLGITKGSYTGNIGDITVLELGTERELGNIKGTTFEGDFTYNDGLSEGTQLLQTQQVLVAAHPLMTIKLQDMTLSSNAEIKNNLQDQSLNYQIKNIDLNGQSFGSFDLGFAVNQLDMKEWVKVVNSQLDTPDAQQLVLSLLKTNPTFAISPLRWTIKDAKVELNTTLQLQVPQDPNDQLQYVKQLNMDVLLDRKALLYSAGDQSMPIFMYDERIAQAEKAGLFTVNGSKAEMSLYAENAGQTIKLNGEAITLPELTARFVAADNSLQQFVAPAVPELPETDEAEQDEVSGQQQAE